MKQTLQTVNPSDNQWVYANFYTIPNPKQLLVIFHGMAEHKERYDDFALFFNKQGFNVLVCDHRGHGQSLFEGHIKGHFANQDGWFLNLEDLHDLIKQAQSISQIETYALLGHSMGSIVAQSYFKRYYQEVSHLILTGVPEIPVGLKGLQLIAKAIAVFSKTQPSHLLYQSSFAKFDKKTPSQEPLAWLSHDQDNIKAYRADPLCGFKFTNQGLVDLLDGFYDVRHFNQMSDNLDTFIWFIVGEDDVSINVDQIQNQMRKYQDLGFSEVVISMISNAAHEVLFDVERQALWDQIAYMFNDMK